MDKQDCVHNHPLLHGSNTSMTPLNDLLTDRQEFHSDLQMDAFITFRAGGTLYGCYKQALRELNTRTTALRSRYTQSALMQVEIDEWCVETTDGFMNRRNHIKAAEARLALEECRRVIFHTEREFLRFFGQCVAIREALAAQGVTFPLDAVTRDRLDREMWEHQLKGRAATELMAFGRIGNTTIELIQCCPREIKQRIEEWLLPPRHSALMAWFMSYEPEMPVPALIRAPDVRKLIGCSA